MMKYVALRIVMMLLTQQAVALEGISEFAVGSNSEVVRLVCGENQTRGSVVLKKASDDLNDKIEKLRSSNLLLAVSTQPTLSSNEACLMTRQRRSWH